MSRHYTPEERRDTMVRFLKAFARYGVMTQACFRANVTSTTVRAWLAKYPKFAAKYEEMRNRFVDDLEMVAIERAKEKSDSLMALLLKANRPEKYKENVKLDADVKSAPIQLVFSQDEWGTMPNYVGGDNDGENAEQGDDNSDA